MSVLGLLVSGSSIGESLPILLLSVLGSAAFIGLALCVRRFDSDPGTDDQGSDGGGGDGDPGPGQPTGPLAAIDPPLGEIRASRKRERVSS